MKAHRLAVALVVLLTTSSIVGAAAVSSTTERAGVNAGQGTVTLTVAVTDNANDDVSGAELTAFWDGGSNTAQTASNGKAFLDVPSGTDVKIYVNHSAYTLNNPVVVEDASQQDVSIETSLKADAQVTVVEDGTPIQDAQVLMYKEGDGRTAASGRTDGSGVFTSGTIEQGTYRVVAFKEGFFRNETTVEVRDTTETTVAITEGTVTVDISVKDDHFDPARTIEDAQIQIEGPTSATLSTGGSGSGTIGLPVNAEFTISITKDGYTSKTRTVTIGEESRTVAFTITKEDALNVEAVNQRIVVGEAVQLSVTDEYGDPVEGASVVVDGETVGQTDAEGVYRATVDSSGSHTITVNEDGVTSSEVTVEGVSSGGNVETNTATDAPAELPDFSRPTFAMKIGVAAVGVLLSFLVVRWLL